MVSKKVGSAVIRNQVKRWLREASRHHYKALNKSVDVVIIAFSSAAHSTLSDLEKQVLYAFDAISKKV